MWRKGRGTMGFTYLEKKLPHTSPRRANATIINFNHDRLHVHSNFLIYLLQILYHICLDTWYLHVMYCSCWIRKQYIVLSKFIILIKKRLSHETILKRMCEVTAGIGWNASWAMTLINRFGYLQLKNSTDWSYELMSYECPTLICE